MPILELQKRARELGRIRIGQKGPKGQPQKLDRFRLTSASQPLIEKIAELYGGSASQWTPQGGAPQWEVITDSTRLPIMVPPQPVTQWLETWTGGGCVHRCDGITEVISGEPCDLGPVHEQAKPTTRLNVVLRDVEGIGVWRLESHGWNAAVELPDVAAFLAQAGGYVNGWLSLEERVSKSLVDGKAQTRRFIVPTIEIDVTPAELLAGRGRVATPQVEGPVGAPQLEAARPDYAAEAEAAVDLDGVREVWRRAGDAGHMTDELKARLTEIGQRHNQPARVEPGDVELDSDALYQQVLAVAGKLGMDAKDMNDEYAATADGRSLDDADGHELARFLDHLNGVVPA